MTRIIEKPPKIIPFVQGMVTGTFRSTRTYRDDKAAVEMAGEIQNAIGDPTDPYALSYAEALLATVSLTFNWHPKVVDEAPDLLAFEDWWKLVEAGKSAAETYTFITEHVHIDVLMEWPKVAASAQIGWKKPEQKMKAKLTEGERNDPNS